MTPARLHTTLCDLLDIRHPVMLAGMGRVSCPELTAAVSNAGGLGILGAAPLQPDTLNEWIEQTRKLTSAPFGVDTLLPLGVPKSGSKGSMKQKIPEAYAEFARRFKEQHAIPDPPPRGEVSQELFGVSQELAWDWTHDFFEKQLEVIMDQRVPVYAAGLGDPSPMLAEFHARGTKVIGIAGNVKHVRRMRDGGVDIIVVQGTEAGGHNSRIGTMALVPQAVDAAPGTPIVAAGGIADGRGLAAALALGAAGVWCGTVFCTTEEAWLSGFLKQAMLDSDEEGTVVSRAVTGKPMRQLKNKWVEEFEASGLTPLPMPFQMILSTPVMAGAGRAHRGDICATAAGQVVGMLHELKPAAQVVTEMVEQAVAVLGRCAQHAVAD
ncbi:MAG: nitronate monooxygenase [Deltaproteobacteria bacterium]|nr:nitronate monooxygenase [Deltaproteobacteria bacterium]